MGREVLLNEGGGGLVGDVGEEIMEISTSVLRCILFNKGGVGLVLRGTSLSSATKLPSCFDFIKTARFSSGRKFNVKTRTNKLFLHTSCF